MNTNPEASRLSPRLTLGLLLLFTLLLRLYGIHHPLTDAQFWRQTDTAAMARNFFSEDMNLLHPRVDWRGETTGYVESDFPLYPYLVAGLYQVAGQAEPMLGRLLSALFAVLTVAVIFGFVREAFDPFAAVVASLVYAAAPLSLYYTRTFMPESLLMFFFMAGLWAFYRWVQKPAWSVWLLAWACASLAAMIKPTALLLVFPMLGMLWDRRGWDGFRDPRVWFFFPALLLAPGLWYWHAHQLFRETGLTFGILGAGYNKFQTFFLWKEIPEIALAHVQRLFGIFLTPVGGGLFLYGLAASLWKLKHPTGRGMLYAWLAAFAVYLVVVLEGNRLLEYYQLFFIPAAGIMIARGLEQLRQGFPSRLFLGAIAAVFLVLSFAIVSPRYQPVAYAGQAYQFARKATALSAATDVFIVIDNNLKYNSFWYEKMNRRISPPHLLYYFNRTGWVFLPHEVEGSPPETIRRFMAKGARCLVLPIPLLDKLPGWKPWLEANSRELLKDDETGLALYRLE